ncbi:MAG: type II toxin-antitoxin system Phd/YefM family antitoxin [Pseudomonadota bacterium]
MSQKISDEVVNVHEAKTHLSRLLDRVSKGETIVIAKSGKPIAKVVPFDTPGANEQQRLGFLDGAFDIPDDFDSIGSDEIDALFQGEDVGPTQ